MEFIEGEQASLLKITQGHHPTWGFFLGDSGS